MCEYTHPPQAGSAKRGAPIGRRVPGRRRPTRTRGAVRRARRARARARRARRRRRARPARRAARSSGRRPPASRRRARSSCRSAQHATGRNSLIANLSAGRASRGRAARTPPRPPAPASPAARRDPNGASSASASRLAAASASGSSSAAAACTRSAIELGQAVEDRRARVAARLLRFARQPIDLTEQGLDVLFERRRPPHAAPHQPGDDALEVGGRGRACAPVAAASPSPCACTTPTARRQSSNRSRMSPSQNSIAHRTRRPPAPRSSASRRSQYRSMPRYATVSGTPRSAHPHTCSNAGPTMRTRWPPFFRQR